MRWLRQKIATKLWKFWIELNILVALKILLKVHYHHWGLAHIQMWLKTTIYCNIRIRATVSEKVVKSVSPCIAFRVSVHANDPELTSILKSVHEARSFVVWKSKSSLTLMMPWQCIPSDPVSSTRSSYSQSHYPRTDPAPTHFRLHWAFTRCPISFTRPRADQESIQIPWKPMK